MTLRELIMTVSTANYCHYTIRCMHRGLVYADVSWGDIPKEYKNMLVYSAAPIKCGCAAIKEWNICLNDASVIK